MVSWIRRKHGDIRVGPIEVDEYRGVVLMVSRQSRSTKLLHPRVRSSKALGSFGNYSSNKTVSLHSSLRIPATLLWEPYISHGCDDTRMAPCQQRRMFGRRVLTWYNMTIPVTFGDARTPWARSDMCSALFLCIGYGKVNPITGHEDLDGE